MPTPDLPWLSCPGCSLHLTIPAEWKSPDIRCAAMTLAVHKPACRGTLGVASKSDLKSIVVKMKALKFKPSKRKHHVGKHGAKKDPRVKFADSLLKLFEPSTK